MAVLLTILAAAGCSQKSAPSEPGKENASTTASTGGGQNQTKLTFWLKKTFSEELDKQLEDRALQFGQENGIEVVVEHISGSNQMEIFNAAIESNSLPDVSFVSAEYGNYFYSQGLLAPIDDVKAEIEAKNGPFIKNLLVSGTMEDGKLYTIPLQGSPRVIYYRDDMLKAAGFQEPPATWEEFRTMAKALTDPSKGVYGFGQPLSPCQDFESNYRALLWSYGGSLWDEEGNVSMDSPETVAATQLWLDMYYEDGSINPDAISWDDSGNNTAYLSGTAAMVINTNTILRALETSGMTDILENTKIAPLPTGPDGERILYGSALSMAVFNSSENLEASKKLLAYIYDVDWYTSWLSGVAGEMSPVFADMAGKEPFVSQENVPMLISELDRFRSPGYPGPYTAYSGQMVANFTMGTAIQEMAMNKQTAAEGLAAVKPLAEALKTK